MAHELKIKNGAIIYSKGANTVVFDVQGENGQLFSVEDDLSGLIMYVADISGNRILEVYDTGSVVILGKLTITDLPTSTTGLNPGDIWNDAGTLKIL